MVRTDYGYLRKCGDYEKPAKVGAGDTAVQGDMLLPANVELTGAEGVRVEGTVMQRED